jgi:hypothetical protein
MQPKPTHCQTSVRIASIKFCVVWGTPGHSNIQRDKCVRNKIPEVCRYHVGLVLHDGESYEGAKT